MEIEVNGKVIKLEVIPIHEIIPYDNNVKIHPVKQLEGLANSLQDFGQKSLPVVDKNNVLIAGHARYEAACAIGWGKLLCIVADDLNDEEVIEYRLVDNEIAALGGTDVKAREREKLKIPHIELGKYGIEMQKIKMPEPKIDKTTEDYKFITCPRCEHEFIQQKT